VGYFLKLIGLKNDGNLECILFILL